jgi:spermidine synthase
MGGLRSSPRLLFALFAVSGFTGLIYESTWSHYLKLFLGHAAYAQSLVLAIFMGGMAAGAWVAARYTGRWGNLLRAYALVEGLIGVLAVFFHEGFTALLGWSFDAVIPTLSVPWTVDLYKWSLAGMLIVPQSMLLGMTFPLMSGGLIRRFPEGRGSNIAMLYFTNSIGAAAGALASAFLLIGWLGLDGTMRLAGTVNLVVAATVYGLARPSEQVPPASAVARERQGVIPLFLAAAFITGTASFIYEIGWVRMLSLVLGSSFHAFELMLSAFIAGLAFGGLWIKRRIDRIVDPIRFGGVVQVVMGTLALSTLALYNHTFEWMGFLVNTLPKSDTGYLWFNLGSHAIAFAIMLPATFCAGMTLPLFTEVLMRAGYGERSIGRVYASNTLGAIAGVMFAVHLAMPIIGLKLLIVSGVVLDIALGGVLLRASSAPRRDFEALGALLAGLAVVAAVVRLVQLDPARMGSGVYRTGQVVTPNSELVYYRDGKTASISLYREAESVMSIRTNGKPDAALEVVLGKPPSGDEVTMAMAAALPLAMIPGARTAANIGFGSGLTTHVLLASPELERVDTIEIEQAMVDGARGFLPRVRKAYVDPRSRVHIEDAKTWFAKNHNRYDIIVSEPSNPWVSGTASLFTDEFYQRIVEFMTERGILVQWLQLYEFNDELVASVLGALGRNFSDYAIYNTDDYDILIVAVQHGNVPRLDNSILSWPDMRLELNQVNIKSIDDMRIRYLGGKALLGSVFSSLHGSARINSDYWPILELEAPKARFLNQFAAGIGSLRSAPLPVLTMLNPTDRETEITSLTIADYSGAESIGEALLIETYLFSAPVDLKRIAEIDPESHLPVLRRLAYDCESDSLRKSAEALEWLARRTLNVLPSSDLAKVWIDHEWLTCDPGSWPEELSKRFVLYRAVAMHDASAMLTLANRFLEDPGVGSDKIERRFFFSIALLGARALGDSPTAFDLWSRYATSLYPRGEYPPFVVLLARGFASEKSTAAVPQR